MKIPSSVPITSQRGTIRVCKYQGEKGKSLVLAAISRPRTKNAFSFNTYLDLIDLFNQVALEPDTLGVILTGTGSYFSSGADLTELSMFDEEQQEKSMIEKPPGQFMQAMLRFPKVIGAAVNGPAVGIGVTLLLHCDLVYSVDTATFWVPFNRIALVPEFCSSITFMESMGLAKANELLLMGKKINATTAEEWNICSRVMKKKNDNDDPFHEESIGRIMCYDVLVSLLDLPHGDDTALIFVKLMRYSRKKRLELICKEELQLLDMRFKRGDSLNAAIEHFGKSKL